MAVVVGLVRGPLRQVGRGPRYPRGRPMLSLNLLLSPRQVSGLLKRRFHRSAPAALQVTGADAAGRGWERVSPQSPGRPEWAGGMAEPGGGRVLRMILATSVPARRHSHRQPSPRGRRQANKRSVTSPHPRNCDKI